MSEVIECSEIIKKLSDRARNAYSQTIRQVLYIFANFFLEEKM